MKKIQNFLSGFMCISLKVMLLLNEYLFLAFYIPLIIVSSSLKSLGVTEFNLWNGNESKWTSILKGTNMETGGKWNEEDSLIVEEYNSSFLNRYFFNKKVYI